jgi:hypothetical protein
VGRTVKEGEKMNGFKLQADTYRKAVEDGNVDKNYADKLCKTLDFLATCDDDDIYNMFDSSAFNEIAKSYMRLAIRELVDEGVLDDDQAKSVRNRYSLLFDEKTAKEVCEVKYVDELHHYTDSGKLYEKEKHGAG